MAGMAERAGDRLASSQFDVLRWQIESYLTVPHLRASIVVDEPGADLDSAASAALTYIDEARRLLAPFFVQKYAVGDRVDVVGLDERTGKELIELTDVAVVAIGDEVPYPTTMVEDARGDQHRVGGHQIRKARHR